MATVFTMSTGSNELFDPELSEQEPQGVPRQTVGQGTSHVCACVCVVSAKAVKRRNTEKKNAIARCMISILG